MFSIEKLLMSINMKTPGWCRHQPSSGVIFVILTLAICQLANGATTHKHDHHGHKERLEDGSYSPRDVHHHGDGGEHNVEFDHEAILGESFVLGNLRAL